MRRVQIGSYLLASLLLTACSGDEQAAPTTNDVAGEQEPLEQVVARMAEIGYAYGASFSPDGKRIAFVSSASGLPQVWISAAEATEQVSFFDDQVGDVRWSPAGDTLAVSVAPGGGLNTQIFLLPLAGGEPRQITAGGKVNNWLADWSPDGRYLAYSSNESGKRSMDCYLYDTQSGESRRIAANDGIGAVVAMSPSSGRAVVWRMRNRGNTDLYLLDVTSGDEQLLTPHDGVALSSHAEFLDEDTLLIDSNIDREMNALARIDIDADGAAGAVSFVAERDDAELDEFRPFDDGARVALLWNAAGQSELRFLDISEGTLSAGPTLPAEIAGGLEVSPDGNSLAVTVSGAATPTNVWRYGVGSNAFAKVSDSAHEGVDLERLIRPTLVRYAAHDGLELSGWLYRPRAADGPGPVVMSFHGGPEGQERPTFRSTYQALLARGVSVFAPNVRGSSGFGKTFVNLDNGELRFDGIRDIESTIDYLIHAGIADPARIGIMGGSYGGYMVMAGLTTYPQRIKAGANLFGIVNFETFFANTEAWMAAISTVEYGDPDNQSELLRRLSPVHNVANIAAPTIVLHGANDTNVPVVEAEQIVENLKERGVPVKYVLFPDEGHGWRKTVNRVTSDVEIVRWFEMYL